MDLIRILLIEDDTIDQLAFKRYIEKEKLTFQLEIVKSLSEAKATLTARSFDIIVSDYHLGDGTALEVCEIERARSQRRFCLA